MRALRKEEPDERRGAERHGVFLRALSLFSPEAPERLLRCSVKDVSLTGARLRVPSRDIRGDVVTLIDSKAGTEQRARIVWRNDTEMGVMFEGPARPGRPRAVEAP